MNSPAASCIYCAALSGRLQSSKKLTTIIPDFCADEVRLMMYADDMMTEFLNIELDDFSKHEQVDLTKKLKGNICVAKKIRIVIFEVDAGFDDDGPYTKEIIALRKSEDDERRSSVVVAVDEVPVTLTDVGARYRLTYTMSRHAGL